MSIMPSGEGGNNIPTIATIAAKRGAQTFLYGLGIDVLVTVALFIVANLDAITNRTALIAAGISLGKTVLIAAASYVIRRYSDKSGVVPAIRDTP